MTEQNTALATRIHAELARRKIIDLLPPPPEPPVADWVEPPPRSQVSPSQQPKVPPPPARASRIVTQQPRSNAPLDLTKDTFVTSSAAAYTGGTTTAIGTNRIAVPTANVDPNARPTNQRGEPDHSRAVALSDNEWRCPWPPETDTEQIDEQAVIIRVKVRPNGTAASAKLVADPGHGFGRAAVACALATRFSPARDRTGRPTETESPPIQIRFTR